MKNRIIKRDSFKVIGRRCVTPSGGGAWDVSRNDGSLKQMEEMETGQPFLGLCFGIGDDGSNDNMVGIEYGEDIIGLDSYVYPPNSWLVVEAEGKISDNIIGDAWSSIYNNILPNSGYKKSDLPTIENYVEWNDEANFCKIEIRIPVEN